MKTWPELGTLSFDYPRISPPPKFKKELQLECVKTNRCIPQGYRLVVFVKTIQHGFECLRIHEATVLNTLHPETRDP